MQVNDGRQGLWEGNRSYDLLGFRRFRVCFPAYFLRRLRDYGRSYCLFCCVRVLGFETACRGHENLILSCGFAPVPDAASPIASTPQRRPKAGAGPFCCRKHDEVWFWAIESPVFLRSYPQNRPQQARFRPCTLQQLPSFPSGACHALFQHLVPMFDSVTSWYRVLQSAEKATKLGRKPCFLLCSSSSALVKMKVSVSGPMSSMISLSALTICVVLVDRTSGWSPKAAGAVWCPLLTRFCRVFSGPRAGTCCFHGSKPCTITKSVSGDPGTRDGIQWGHRSHVRCFHT
jgi:hypothetical protein